MVFGLFDYDYTLLCPFQYPSHLVASFSIFFHSGTQLLSHLLMHWWIHWYLSRKMHTCFVLWWCLFLGLVECSQGTFTCTCEEDVEWAKGPYCRQYKSTAASFFSFVWPRANPSFSQERWMMPRHILVLPIIDFGSCC